MKDSKIRHDGNQVISSGPSKLCKNLWTQIESDGLLLGIKSQKLMIPCQLVLRRRENLILNVPVFTASLVIGHKENSNCVGHWFPRQQKISHLQAFQMFGMVGGQMFYV